MAALAGFSRCQTLRAFADLTGLTPHAYTVQKRLDLARLWIRRETPLAEAAIEAGFGDQSHMHRAFVARYGYTPGQYARAHRAHAANSSKINRTEEHTSELQALMRISYAVFCLKKKKTYTKNLYQTYPSH